CRIPNIVYSTADFGDSWQCRHGTDDWCHDDPQHSTRTTGHELAPRTLLGPDRLDVAWQPDTCCVEPAVGRIMGEAAENSVLPVVSSDSGVLRHWRILGQSQHLRCRAAGTICCCRLCIVAAELRSRSFAAWPGPGANA